MNAGGPQWYGDPKHSGGSPPDASAWSHKLCRAADDLYTSQEVNSSLVKTAWMCWESAPDDPSRRAILSDDLEPGETRGHRVREPIMMRAAGSSGLDGRTPQGSRSCVLAGASAGVALNVSTASCDAANPPRAPHHRPHSVRTPERIRQVGGLARTQRVRGVQERCSLKSIKSTRPNLLRCQGGEAELHADFEMLGFLGRGGFGTVRKARDRTTGLIRAIKSVHCAEGAGEEAWERLFGEVEALMAMGPHPNIVRLHGYYREKDTPTSSRSSAREARRRAAQAARRPAAGGG